MKNPAAVALGRMAKGIKKTLTDAERAARRARLDKVRHLRRVPVKFHADETFEPTIDSNPAVGDVCSHCRKAECQ